MRSAIVVLGVVGLAIATSQLRGMASQSGKLETQSFDDELMALSAKHQVSQLPNGVTALLVSIFAVLGGVIFTFYIHDAQEEEAAEPSANETAKEAAKVKGNEQQSEAQPHSLWPCTPFHARGLMRSAIVVLGVVGLAIATSQLRGMASQSGKLETQSFDDELMVLSANHQVS